MLGVIYGDTQSRKVFNPDYRIIDMPSWTCSLCDTEERWPTKDPAMEHIRENHMETLVRATLERSQDDPNEDLDFDPHESVVESKPSEDV